MENIRRGGTWFWTNIRQQKNKKIIIIFFIRHQRAGGLNEKRWEAAREFLSLHPCSRCCCLGDFHFHFFCQFGFIYNIFYCSTTSRAHTIAGSSTAHSTHPHSHSLNWLIFYSLFRFLFRNCFSCATGNSHFDFLRSESPARLVFQCVLLTSSCAPRDRYIERESDGERVVVKVLAYLVNRAAFKTLHLFLLIHFVSFSACKNVVAVFFRLVRRALFSSILPFFIHSVAGWIQNEWLLLMGII